MKKELSAKSVVLFFLLLLALYVAAFYGWEYSQRRLGPWRIEFSLEAGRDPAMTVHQPGLGIASVRLVFQGENAAMISTNLVVTFDRVRQPPPFGKIIHEDLRSMPGILTFGLFGHEVELRPRSLVVNRKEMPWVSGQIIQLSPTDRLSK